MHISSFVNDPDGISAHSNEYAAGTVSMQSFSERKQVEKDRSVIGAYMHSQIGASYIDRSVLRKPAPRLARAAVQKSSRQEMNSRAAVRYQRPDGQHTFREPTSRGYDPYA